MRMLFEVGAKYVEITLANFHEHYTSGTVMRSDFRLTCPMKTVPVRKSRLQQHFAERFGSRRSRDGPSMTARVAIVTRVGRRARIGFAIARDLSASGLTVLIRSWTASFKVFGHSPEVQLDDPPTSQHG
jgi:hypothetical protein